MTTETFCPIPGYSPFCIWYSYHRDYLKPLSLQVSSSPQPTCGSSLLGEVEAASLFTSRPTLLKRVYSSTSPLPEIIGCWAGGVPLAQDQILAGVQGSYPGQSLLTSIYLHRLFYQITYLKNGLYRGRSRSRTAMSAKGGVRSLLAKFENNQSNSTSPHSRGLSPGTPDAGGQVRPLSNVRANFVVVREEFGQGSILGLRKSENSQDVKGSAADDGDVNRKPVTISSENAEAVDLASSSPSQNSHPGTDGLQHNGVDNVQRPSGRQPGRNGTAEEPPANQSSTPENASTPASVGQKIKQTSQATEKKDTPLPKKTSTSKTVTKRPSTISIDNKNASKSALIQDLKTPTLKTPEAPGFRISEARQSDKPSQPRDTKEPVKATTKKPSSCPPPDSRGNSKRSIAYSSPNHNSQTKAPAQAARLSASMAVPTASSITKTGNPPQSLSRGNLASSGLSRKPSVLLGAKTEPSSRLTAATTTSLRRQPSRQSLPAQPPLERPRSRVSVTSTRAPDETFLARMMRPTASSANKMHEKVEPRSPPKSVKVLRPPKKSSDKVDNHDQKSPKASDLQAKKDHGVSKPQTPIAFAVQAISPEVPSGTTVQELETVSGGSVAAPMLDASEIVQVQTPLDAREGAYCGPAADTSTDVNLELPVTITEDKQSVEFTAELSTGEQQVKPVADSSDVTTQCVADIPVDEAVTLPVNHLDEQEASSLTEAPTDPLDEAPADTENTPAHSGPTPDHQV